MFVGENRTQKTKVGRVEHKESPETYRCKSRVMNKLANMVPWRESRNRCHGLLWKMCHRATPSESYCTISFYLSPLFDVPLSCCLCYITVPLSRRKRLRPRPFFLAFGGRVGVLPLGGDDVVEYGIRVFQSKMYLRLFGPIPVKSAVVYL